MILKQIKRNDKCFCMDPCSYLSVADSYGSHSHYVVALKFICNKRNKKKNTEQLGKKNTPS